MVVTVVGDVKASEAMPIVEKIFSRAFGASQARHGDHHRAGAEFRADSRVARAVAAALSRRLSSPDYRSPDDQIYERHRRPDVEATHLTPYRALVRDKQIAFRFGGFTECRNQVPQLFAFYAFPIPGHTTQEVSTAIHAEIERLKKEDVSDEELKMIKTRAKANLIGRWDRMRDWRSRSLESGTL